MHSQCIFTLKQSGLKSPAQCLPAQSVWVVLSTINRVALGQTGGQTLFGLVSQLGLTYGLTQFGFALSGLTSGLTPQVFVSLLRV